MKKIVGYFITLMFVIGLVSGCGKEEIKSESAFKEENGVLVCMDTEKSPFEKGGIKIEIKKGEEGYAKFTKVDDDGKETVEYYLFDYNNNTVEKYYYVAPMGTGFYYYYDLEKGQLIRVEDNDHKDSTASVKESGRWEKAANGTKLEIQSIEEYFNTKFSKTIKEEILEK